MPQDVIALTKGSRYRIESMETRERTKVTKGIFRGYATIGTDDAIVIELDDSHQELKGKLRLIPLHVVLEDVHREDDVQGNQSELPLQFLMAVVQFDHDCVVGSDRAVAAELPLL